MTIGSEGATRAGHRLDHAPGFASAAERVLRHLHDRLGFSLWIVSQVEGDESRVISAVGDGWSVPSADLHSWGTEWCSRVVQDSGSTVIVDGSGPVGSYIGVPILNADGSLFGSICGIDPHPQPPSIEGELDTLELFSELLSSLLASETARHAAETRNHELEAQAVRDGLTGLLNRAGWNQVMEREAERSLRYEHGSAVVVVDMDGLKAHNDAHGHAHGDELLRTLGESITSVSRASDPVARLGGDEFALLAIETAPGASVELSARLRDELDRRGITASVGAVDCPPGCDLFATWQAADMAMYENKRARREA